MFRLVYTREANNYSPGLPLYEHHLLETVKRVVSLQACCTAIKHGAAQPKVAREGMPGDPPLEFFWKLEAKSAFWAHLALFLVKSWLMNGRVEYMCMKVSL